MRNLIMPLLFMVACSTYQPPLSTSRGLSSRDKALIFDIQVNRTPIFANGADFVQVNFSIKDENGEKFEINPKEIKVLLSGEAKISEISANSGQYQFSITPKIKSPSFKFALVWKENAGQIIDIKTTLKPLKVKRSSQKNQYVSSKSVNGLSYGSSSYAPDGQYEQFSLENRGKNSMVSAQDSSRSFDFDFEEQATQNNSFMVMDAPNGTTSHAMFSHFMIFPRTYLPFAEKNKNEEVTVTLANGESLTFSKSGEIIDGVFTEGPVDVGPDRHKRIYPNLKYQGSGILLRANARGQLPQQGQFEATKIDMEYGVKYSSDVLILNGQTGQRCRRPKADFWLQADVSPLLFKFPSDQEFNAYLLKNCGFGLPEPKEEVILSEVKAEREINDTWNSCEATQDLKNCLSSEVALLKDTAIRAKVNFVLSLRYLNEKKREKLTIDSTVIAQMEKIQSTLLKDASWAKKGCVKASREMISVNLKFHDIKPLMEKAIEENCTKLPAEIEKNATDEVAPIKQKLLADFSWAKVSSQEEFIKDCSLQARSYILSSFRYALAPEFYTASLKKMCLEIEASSQFESWLKSQGRGLEEKLLGQILIQLEASHEIKAKACLSEFPMDTILNRLKHKIPRENCLYDAWPQLEAEALDSVKKDPLVMKIQLPMENLKERLKEEKRRLQLKITKKFFL